MRLTKSEREEKARAEEERLRQIEERLMRADVEPETADDFDRALLAKPNSSALWVKYMAFHLQVGQSSLILVSCVVLPLRITFSLFYIGYRNREGEGSGEASP